MMKTTETYRVNEYLKGELPPPVGVRVEVFPTDKTKPYLDRTREVMAIIASQEVTDWPSDERWLEMLSSWFLGSFEEHTFEEIVANEELWTFGSWLDAMKGRGWEWWSSKKMPNHSIISLFAFSWPYSLGPIEYLIRVSGASIHSISELTAK